MTQSLRFALSSARFALTSSLLLSWIALPGTALASSSADIEESLALAARSIKNFQIVVPGKIYRGALPGAEGFAALRRLGVKTDISLIKGGEMGYSSGREERLATEHGVSFHHFPMSGGMRTIHERDVDAVLDLMSDERNYPLFVHCRHGRDRTGMVVGLYRVLRERSMTAAQAWREMLHFGFRRVLMGLNCTYRAMADYRPSRICAALPTFPSSVRGGSAWRAELAVGMDWADWPSGEEAPADGNSPEERITAEENVAIEESVALD